MALKTIARSVVNGLLLRKLPRPFLHESGHCWYVPLTHLRPRADDAGAPRRSRVVLHEDGRPLRGGHALHDDIRYFGIGHYSHFEDRLLFSTSDNSNPNENGRVYAYSLSPWLYRRRMNVADSGDISPVNYNKMETGPEKIRADVEHAWGIAQYFRDHLRPHLPSLKGKKILECGPGINFGTIMTLAAYGAIPLVADRFLAPWQADYHGAFYTALADEVSTDPEADVAPIRALVAANGYRNDTLVSIESSMEKLALPDNSIDCIISSAVMEHVFDQPQAIAETYRVTRPGGWGMHTVDYRDHRDFTRPLEYLLFSETEFRYLSRRCHCECGNQARPSETASWAKEAGFEVVLFQEDNRIQPDYLTEFLPRLRAANNSRYCRSSVQDLTGMTATVLWRKPG